MQVRKKVAESLKKGLTICDIALSNIHENLEEFEVKYSMSTEEFNEKFEKGLLSDDQDFFEWNVYVETYNDWQNRKKALEKIAEQP